MQKALRTPGGDNRDQSIQSQGHETFWLADLNPTEAFFFQDLDAETGAMTYLPSGARSQPVNRTPSCSVSVVGGGKWAACLHYALRSGEA